ncbi:MAG: DUF192 domain-containing protein [Elainellaceae cyanobacterium]
MKNLILAAIALKGRALAITLGLGLFAASCSTAIVPLPLSPPAAAPPAASPPAVSTKDAPLASSPYQGQVLPISATVDIRGTQIALEVAETPAQRATGLMFRPEIPADRGMLFPFSPSRPVQFWMRNVQVPLDMVFLYQGRVEAIAAEVPPCTTLPCPTYGPLVEIDNVIELRGGRAEELGLQVGDRLRIDPVEQL